MAHINLSKLMDYVSKRVTETDVKRGSYALGALDELEAMNLFILEDLKEQLLGQGYTIGQIKKELAAHGWREDI